MESKYFTTENLEILHGELQRRNMTDNDITRKIIGCSLNVHTTLGPDLLESA